QALATNTASLVLDRHAGGADASRNIDQRDPRPDRLQRADQGRSTP
ncbi:integrating conjugative element protein, partial [Klebsiella pneumoniae]|nr:integrating conjugative element protein [Klebsiella pneumoniae]